MTPRSSLDSPAAGAASYAESILLDGWVHALGRDSVGCAVRAWLDGEPIGATHLLFVRPDVCRALDLPAGTPTGFRILACAPARTEASTAEVRVTVSWEGDAAEYEIARITLQLVPSRLAQRPYGDVVAPERETLLHRSDIYGSGPPIEEPGGETLQLLAQYLVPGSVVDVGCGAGAYGAALRTHGHEWLGLEVNSDCCARLQQRGLPFRAVDPQSGRLPGADGEFAQAICIEVLEHIAEPDRFLSEIARIVRARALFSVPNLEVIPYFNDWQVVPWHLLEGDHKNFFTRASLRALLQRHFAHVEVISYAEHPLRTRDDIAQPLHLFAIAEKGA